MERPSLIKLARDALSMELCPHLGGSITALDFHAGGAPIPIFRPTTAEALASGDPVQLASFPLVPYSNRIGGGTFRFRGVYYSVSRNRADEAFPLHGNGWLSPWSVQEVERDAAELRFLHEQANEGWPWAFAATQRFELSGARLRIEMAVRNLDREPMPAGLGIHPFFPGAAEARLTARLPQVWLSEEDLLPRELVDVPMRWDFSEGRPIAGTGLDHCFSGWDGRATIDWPSLRVRVTITADPLFRHMVIYSPEGGTAFCVEPLSHANNALNLIDRGVPNTGLHALDSGEELRGTVHFTVETY